MSVSPQAPPIQAQPKVGELIELYDRGDITREELRHQLTLATAQSLSSPSLQVPMARMIAEPDTLASDTLSDEGGLHATEPSSPARARRRRQQGA